MKFSIFLLCEAPSDLRSDVQVFQEGLRLAQLADELGFDTVWLNEHHFTDYGICGSPNMLAAAIAVTTERIRIGVAVYVLPFNDPIRLAEEINTLDVLSNGRATVGVGRGYQFPEFEGFGIDMAESRERFDECLTILQKCWSSEEPFSYEGKFYTTRDVTIRPAPVQKPHPPMYIAVMRSPETVDYALDHGYQIMGAGRSIIPNLPDGTEGDLLKRYLDGAQERGIQNPDVPQLRMTYVGENDEKAQEEAEPFAMNFAYHFARNSDAAATGKAGGEAYKHYVTLGEAESLLSPIDDRTPERMIGSPETVAEGMRNLASRSGTNHIICWVEFGGIPYDLAAASMRRLAEDVIPRVRESLVEA